MTGRWKAAMAAGVALGAALAAATVSAREIDPAGQTRYYMVSEDDTLLAAADSASLVQLAGGHVRVDVVFVYAAPEEGKAAFYFSGLEFDCQGGDTGQGWRSYSRAAAGADAVVLGRSAEASEWKPVQKGTVSEGMYRYACSQEPLQDEAYFTGTAAGLRAGYLSRHAGQNT